MDPNAGNQLVKVLTNQPSQLIAEQLTPTSSNWVPIIMLLSAVAFAIYFYRIRYWRGQFLPLALVLTAMFSFNYGGDTYRLELDKTAGKINYSHEYDGKTENHSVNLTDISSADMQSNRGATRIALILKDGTQILPLSENNVQDAPNHYVILTAIRNAIGQVPPE